MIKNFCDCCKREVESFERSGSSNIALRSGEGDTLKVLDEFCEDCGKALSEAKTKTEKDIENKKAKAYKAAWDRIGKANAKIH
jgi:hypothetical protein